MAHWKHSVKVFKLSGYHSLRKIIHQLDDKTRPIGPHSSFGKNGIKDVIIIFSELISGKTNCDTALISSDFTTQLSPSHLSACFGISKEGRPITDFKSDT